MSAPVPAPARGPRFEVNEQLEAAGALFRAHLLKCLPLTMVAVLGSSAADFYWRITGHGAAVEMSKAGTPVLPEDPAYWLITIAGMLLSVLLTSAVMLRLRALQSGKQPSVAENLRAAAARWLPATAATLLSLLAVALGLLALIVPGIYLAVCTVVLLPVVLFEPVEPVAALVRCFRLVRPIWVRVFACALIAGLIGIICLVALSVVMGLLLGALGKGQLGQAVLQAIVMAGEAIFFVFIAALWLTIYTAASSSA